MTNCCKLGQVTLQIEVEDTGIGIAPDFCPHVFTPFSQMDGSDSRKYGGTGLGLAVTKCLVDLLGGRIDSLLLIRAKYLLGVITFTSVLDQGSKFSVRVPLDVVEVSPQSLVFF